MAPSTSRQLTDGDAIFLSMETPESGGHVGALMILDPPEGGFDHEKLCRFIAERIGRVPRFTWKLQEVPLGLDRPYWVEAEDFDPRDHVIRTAVASPGTREQVNALVARLHAQPMDRDRPLWEAWCIEGLAGGQVGLYMKSHHCLVDGAGGSGLGGIIADLSPDSGGPPVLPDCYDEELPAAPSAREMATRALRNGARRPARRLHHVRRGLRGLARGLFTSDDSPEIQRLSFNGVIGKRRGLSTLSLEFERVRDLSKHFDVKVNDVVLAIVDSAVRRWLRDRGESAEKPLVAMCPVSTREEAGLGNEITSMVVPLADADADPGERLRSIHVNATRAKEGVRKGSFDWTAAVGESFAPAAVSLLVRASSKSAENVPLPGNFVVSNVRATPMPLYLAGARIASVLPISMLAPGQGLNVTLISYCHRIDVGIITDPELVPDLDALTPCFEVALEEFEAAAEGVIFRRG